MSAAAPRMSNERERWRMGIEARALVLATALLVAFGLATLYSASAFEAVAHGKASAYFLLKQLAGFAVGVTLFAIAAKIDAELWRRHAWPLMGLALFLMVLTVLPFTRWLAPPILGSRRYLYHGSIQPSEFAKLAVVVWTAMLVVKKGDALRRLSKGLAPILLVIGALDVMALLEPDFSTVLFFSLQMAVIVFAAGARIGHFVFLGAVLVPVMWKEMQRLQYVMQRLLGFGEMANAAHATVNYQLKQSLIAVGSGGWFGAGFGEGRQQNGFLPLSYDDFIGGTIGEEWGFAGMVVLVALFALWGWLGFRIARQARTPFQQLAAIGITVTVIVTAYLHIGVVIGLLPTTGLTLPFISYGRSNLILSMLMTGLLVNIGSSRERVRGEGATNPMLVPAR
ncbi:MAG TPA: putative peptidoglycan glycosyltransferase FtsW [Gemmatimonadaceae bacterium]|nr:putative peptidoglycan glycosyltransferase FtsW [Gemmatimonadaceae bacterium]